MKRRIFSILICLIVAMCWHTVSAQLRFDRTKLYAVCSVKYSDKAWTFGKSGKVQLTTSNEADKSQLWSITDLSGSFRLVNPFEDKRYRLALTNWFRWLKQMGRMKCSCGLLNRLENTFN